MVTLTKSDILKLYGVKSNEDLVVFGRNVTNIVKNPARRKLTLDDYGSAEYNEHYDRIRKTPSKPVAPVIESEVKEIEIF
jgi:hypothetical protein